MDAEPREHSLLYVKPALSTPTEVRRMEDLYIPRIIHVIRLRQLISTNKVCELLSPSFTAFFDVRILLERLGLIEDVYEKK